VGMNISSLASALYDSSLMLHYNVGTDGTTG
jgi:hypothetical protein